MFCSTKHDFWSTILHIFFLLTHPFSWQMGLGLIRLDPWLLAHIKQNLAQFLHIHKMSAKLQQTTKKYLHLLTALHAKTHNTMKAYWRPGCTNNLCNDVFKIFIIIFLFSMLRNMEQLESASKTKTDAGVTFQFSCRHMYLAETKLFLFITLVDISCLFWANVLSCVFIGCSNILCYISMASNHVPSMHFMSIKLCNQIL